MSIAKVNKSIIKLNPIITKIDDHIMRFMWRHRVTTFEALRTLFYPNLPPHAAYYKLNRLRHGGYLETLRFKGSQNLVWCLAKRGFQHLELYGLHETKSKGFKPQSLYHDFLVTSALLGDWRLSPPNNVIVVSEQELQNSDLFFMPNNLQGDFEHRPDGLWVFDAGKEKYAVALEVETSGKSSERYEKICSFYSRQLFFKIVVWIVEEHSLGEKILSCASRNGNPRKDMHLFLSKDDYLETGWDTKFLNPAMKGTTLATYLNGLAGAKSNNGTSLQRVCDESATSPVRVCTPADIFLNLAINTVKFSTLRKHHSRKNS